MGYFPVGWDYGKGCMPSSGIHRKNSQAPEKKNKYGALLLPGLRISI